MEGGISDGSIERGFHYLSHIYHRGYRVALMVNMLVGITIGENILTACISEYYGGNKNY